VRYRKKPVVVEAIQWTGQDISDFVGYDPFDSTDCTRLPKLFINTLEGSMEASMGDYIIKGIKGEFYPCKPDIFDLTYEKAE
jgi:hypothetical protein